MRRVLSILGLLVAWALLLGAPACPPPAPQPTPTPCVSCPAGQHCEGYECVADPPPPCPELEAPWCHEMTPPQECGLCKHQPPAEKCPIMAPECPPEPPPTPTCPAECPAGQACTDPAAGCVAIPPPPGPTECPAAVVHGIEHGRHQMTAKPHVGRWYDSTPRVCGDAALCAAVGRPTQLCCPLGPECVDGQPCFREACETLFLGGPTPQWQAGDPGITFEPSALAFTVLPRGTGRIRACDRAGVTCSAPWIEIDQ